MQHVYVAIAAGLLGWGLTGLVLAAARQTQQVAMPTDRGLHKIPTPVGGGLGLLGAALIVWGIMHWPLHGFGTVAAWAMGVLAGISWLDDRQPLPPIVRLAAQICVVGLVLWMLPSQFRLAPTIPLGVERAALALAWLWVINLTNFMDGIDGLAGTEAVSVGLGYVVIVGLFPGDQKLFDTLPDLSLLVAAAAVGYLYWNWAPARIFMGDVGSIPLGFLFGCLMLDLALRGQWAAACILPAYFLADATATLVRRLGRGAKPWQPHREHAYQKAVLSGMSHAQVTAHVAVLNVALIALAVLAAHQPYLALALAAMLTLSLMAWLGTRQRTPG